MYLKGIIMVQMGDQVDSGGQVNKPTESSLTSRAHRIIAERIFPVCTSHPCIEKVYLFGSYARGDFNRLSDVDLWVHLDRDRYEIGLAEYVDIQTELRAVLTCPVDIVTNTAPQSLGNLYASIMEDGVLLYDRSACGQPEDSGAVHPT